MKPLLTLLCFAGVMLFSPSCKRWGKLPDGREYRFDYTCISSHVEIVLMPTTVMGAANIPTIINQPMPQTVCDLWQRSDTIFKTK